MLPADIYLVSMQESCTHLVGACSNELERLGKVAFPLFPEPNNLWRENPFLLLPSHLQLHPPQDISTKTTPRF